MSKNLLYIFTALCIGALSGCGGGGDATTANPPVNPPANSTPSPRTPTGSALAQTTTLSGFSVTITGSALTAANLDQALNQLQVEIDEALRRVPKLATFKGSLRFWLTDRRRLSNAVAEYHPYASWLTAIGLDPAMARGIEISNLTNFLAWHSEADRSVVLHEMAHVYHFQILGRVDPRIQTAFQAALSRGIYDSVLYQSPDGTTLTGKAYALANEFEFFAETSESYFGTNPFYPFNRSQLQSFDPASYQLMVDIWGDS